MKPFTVNDLLETAKQRAGLADFGPGEFVEGLAVLVNGLNNDVKVVEDRRDNLRDWLINLLVNRLRFQHDLILHPEILDEDLGTPAIITSMPRTASTKLHRMLAASNDFQVLKFWHVHMFARIPDMADGGKSQRIKETQEFERWMYEVCPQMLNGHPQFTYEAEEDSYLNECTFKLQMLAGRFGSETYQNWLATVDVSSSYAYLRTQLQYLQWQNKAQADKPWLLKAPGNFGMEQRLFDLYGGARFVMTHRDPVKCIPSISSVVLGTRELFLEQTTYEKAGLDMSNFFSHQVQEHMRWRDENPDLPILDLGFDEITFDGISAVRKLYNFLDISLSVEAENAMLAWERNNAKGKHGTHKYSIEGSGLTEEGTKKDYEEYIQRYSDYF
ncbi:MAG: sulfotransferase [Halieaceae bacterium]|nr:sulfotransferase [Halieaceae bacterium]